MLRNISRLLAAIFMLALPPSAQAATVTPSGITNLEVTGLSGGTRFFDVTFQDGTCAALFDGCDSQSDLLFSEADFAVAMTALAAQLNIATTQGYTPNGCAVSVFCEIWSPILIYHANLAAVKSVWMSESVSPDWFYEASSTIFISSEDSSTLPATTFATWKEVAPVPLPASGLLLMGGLAGLAGLKRRARKAL